MEKVKVGLNIHIKLILLVHELFNQSKEYKNV